MTLHLISKSPYQQSALKDCTKIAAEGDALLLIEDGAYGAIANTELDQIFAGLASQSIEVYALRPDIDSRGLAARLSRHVQLIDFAEFVALTEQHTSSQSWF